MGAQIDSNWIFVPRHFMHMAVKRTPGETVVFAWIAWPSKAVRDAAMKKIMEDPRMDPKTNPMPFDGKCMTCGGFPVPVQA